MPPFLLGATLLLWGWQLDLLWLGAVAAVLLEAARWLPWRWEVADAGMRRTALLGYLLLFVLAGYGVVLVGKRDIAFALLSFVAWLPIASLPALMLQLWGADAAMDLRRLISLRAEPDKPALHIQIAWLCWAAFLLAASVAPGAQANASRAEWFYAALCLLLGWGLWSQRRTGVSPVRWAAVVLCTAALGLAFHLGLHRLQGELENNFGEWFTGMESGGDSDPSRSSTAIGRIGELKLSERIVLRVRSEQALKLPLLLRDASYTHYIASSWMVRVPNFKPLQPAADGHWQLASAATPPQRLQISYALKNGKGLLVLPAGTVAVRDLPAGRLEMSRLGVVLVSDGAPRLDYRVDYNGIQTDAAGETADDLQVPPQLEKLFARITTELQLSGKPAGEAMDILRHYFDANFRYSLVQRAPDAGAAPLAEFLLRSHAGHCEYFATATVLLLRSAGIPARYATGYSIQEYNNWEKAYVARARHAHAWAQVYVDGAWQDLDTTPARWAEFESEQTPRLQWLADFANWALDRMLGIWHATDIGTLGARLVWLMIPALIYAAWRLRRLRWRRKTVPSQPDQTPLIQQGLDSEWYAFAQSLEATGLTRPAWEPLEAWARRAGLRLGGEGADALQTVIVLHYRYRFDPQGLSQAERQELSELVVLLSKCVTAIED